MELGKNGSFKKSMSIRLNTCSASYKPVDFCNGPAELVDSIIKKRECILSARWHLTLMKLLKSYNIQNNIKIQKYSILPNRYKVLIIMIVVYDVWISWNYRFKKYIIERLPLII